jgi:hypothetical protein
VRHAPGSCYSSFREKLGPSELAAGAAARIRGHCYFTNSSFVEIFTGAARPFRVAEIRQ